MSDEPPGKERKHFSATLPSPRLASFYHGYWGKASRLWVGNYLIYSSEVRQNRETLPTVVNMPCNQYNEVGREGYPIRQTHKRF